MFKRKETIIILWMTFVTVAAWIVLSIYHIWVNSTISPIDASAIAPIDPKFDMNTINKLRMRERVEPLYQFNESSEGKEASKEAEISPSTESVNPQVSQAP